MKKETIMIVDDEPDVLESLSAIFESKGFRVLGAASGKEAMVRFTESPAPVILCDNELPDAQGITLLNEFRTILPDVQMVMISGKGTIDIAVSAMKSGIFDFITKPFDPNYLFNIVMRAYQMADALMERRALKEQVDMMTDREVVGSHSAFKSVIRLAATVAPTDSTVLIEGESGTGKEIIARYIHKRSGRGQGPFVAVDCGAIPEGLVESELFGHEKGAFTGAMFSKSGKFERARNGTLFLDEITNLPLASQSKLLRALQEMVIERVGATKHIPVNFRLIAASNVPLQEAVREKRFREDLYYRLNIVKIKLPPLRERKSDMLQLSMLFIDKHRERIGSPARYISKSALRVMMDYMWPGNVRELENAIEHALIMAKGDEILPQDLPELEGLSPSRSTLDEAEREMIMKAIKDSGGNKLKAAKLLGIPRSSLYSKMKKCGILLEG